MMTIPNPRRPVGGALAFDIAIASLLRVAGRDAGRREPAGPRNSRGAEPASGRLCHTPAGTCHRRTPVAHESLAGSPPGQSGRGSAHSPHGLWPARLTDHKVGATTPHVRLPTHAAALPRWLAAPRVPRPRRRALLRTRCLRRAAAGV